MEENIESAGANERQEEDINKNEDEEVAFTASGVPVTWPGKSKSLFLLEKGERLIRTSLRS